MFPKVKINNELLGILYMLLCQFSFATNDAFVKNIYEHFDEIFVLNQIIFIRGIFTLLFIVLFLYIKKQLNFKLIFSSTELKIRGLLESLAALFFFIGRMLTTDGTDCLIMFFIIMVNFFHYLLTNNELS